MTHQFSTSSQLASFLVEEYYGAPNRIVLDVLSSRGIQSLREIMSGVKGRISTEKVKQSLLVLMQHNFVQSFLDQSPPSLKGPGSQTTVYIAQIHRVVQIIRYPRFLNHVKLEHGEVAQKLVQILLENGRLSQDGIVTYTLGELGGDEVSNEEVKQAFQEMVLEQYIEQCPPANLPPPQQLLKGARGRAKDTDANAFKIMLEEQRQDYQKSRFQIPDSTDSGFFEPEPGEKRSSEQVQDSLVLWRVNFEEFNKRFRHQKCGQYIRVKEGQAKGIVVEALLRAQRKQETDMCAQMSQLVSPGETSTEVERLCSLYENFEAPMEEVEDLLQELTDSEFGYVKEGPEGPQGDCYTVDMDAIIHLMKLKHMEEIIKLKFDSAGLRIFKQLYMKGFLEDRIAADLAMVEIKHCRSLLMQMFQAGYVSLQEIARTSDHKPMTTIYTYFVNLEQAFSQVAKDVYKYELNLCLRAKFEHEQEKDLLNLVQLAQGVDKLNMEQKQRLLRVNKKTHTVGREYNQTG
eukprot:TRINITY_DN1327_c0_g1_i2.p1 TRINITY_DN1327_c0_g1~~TRINITY_DN1327_c0_g1_i2.p1  ORF type:complete len:516 (+),score=51.71 TRINITY_DN1327_c0_g1_i2:39-1586(+)